MIALQRDIQHKSLIYRIEKSIQISIALSIICAIGIGSLMAYYPSILRHHIGFIVTPAPVFILYAALSYYYKGFKALKHIQTKVEIDRDQFEKITQFVASHLAEWSKSENPIYVAPNNQIKHKIFVVRDRRNQLRVMTPGIPIQKGSFAEVTFAVEWLTRSFFACKKAKLEHENLIRREFEFQQALTDSLHFPKPSFGLVKVKDDVLFYFEDLYDGDLYSFLKLHEANGTSLSRDEKINLMGQLLKGLAHLAEKRIYHRDISTDNIFLLNTLPLTAHIADFNLAVCATDSDRVLNWDAGKNSMLSPEMCFLRFNQFQNKGTERFTRKFLIKNDVWCMGVTLAFIFNLPLINTPFLLIKERYPQALKVKNNQPAFLPIDRSLEDSVDTSFTNYLQKELNYPTQKSSLQLSDDPFEKLIYQMLQYDFRHRTSPKELLEQFEKLKNQESQSV